LRAISQARTPHARITAIDTSAAEKTAGVRSVYVIAPAGTEIHVQGKEVAALSADTEDIARDAVRKIKVITKCCALSSTAQTWPVPERAASGRRIRAGRSDKSLQDAESSARHLRNSDGHPLLPGTARLRDSVERRPGAGVGSTQLSPVGPVRWRRT
jgi:xanthine dehydrogenase molybdopterin-binding subunit B